MENTSILDTLPPERWLALNTNLIIAALLAVYVTPIIKERIAGELEEALDNWGDKKLKFLTNHVKESVSEAVEDFERRDLSHVEDTVSNAINDYDFSSHVEEAVNSTLAKSLRRIANDL